MNSVQTIRNQFPFLIPVDKSSKELETAILNGDRKGVEQFCQQHPLTLLSQKLPNGEYPLNFAIKKNKEEIVEILLKAGCNPILADEQKLTAIDYALLSGNSKSALLLFTHLLHQEIQHVEEVLAKPIHSNSLAHICAEISVAKSQCQSYAFSPLHSIVAQGDALELSQQLNQMNPAFVNQQTVHGWSALHFAAAMGRIDLIQLLIKHGADINARDRNGMTPLAFLAFFVKQKHPFKIYKLDLLIFLSSLILWSTHFISSHNADWRLLNALRYLVWPARVAMEFSSFQSFPSWKTYLLAFSTKAFVRNLLSEQHPIHLIFAAWQIGFIGKSLFEGLHTSWKNRFLGPGRVLLKTILTQSPKIYQLFSAAQQIDHGLQRQHEAEFWAREKECRTLTNARYSPCMDLSSRMSKICYAKSSEAEQASCEQVSASFADFVKRATFEKENIDFLHTCGLDVNDTTCGNEDTFTANCLSACIEKRNAYLDHCQHDFYSKECLGAEKSFKDFLTDPTQFPHQLVRDHSAECQAARKELTGHSDASLQSIRKSYHQLAMRSHPDKSADVNAHDEITRINRNYAKAISCQVRQKAAIPFIEEDSARVTDYYGSDLTGINLQKAVRTSLKAFFEKKEADRFSLIRELKLEDSLALIESEDFNKRVSKAEPSILKHLNLADIKMDFSKSKIKYALLSPHELKNLTLAQLQDISFHQKAFLSSMLKAYSETLEEELPLPKNLLELTLVKFKHLSGQQISHLIDRIPLSAMSFITSAQIVNLDFNKVSRTQADLLFSDPHTAPKLFAVLSNKQLIALLPKLDNRLIHYLSDEQLIGLDCFILTPRQLETLFPLEPQRLIGSRRRFSLFSQTQIKELLPNMSDPIPLLSDMQLRQLDLSQLNQKHLNDLFSTDVSSLMETKRRCALLSLDQINSILPRLSHQQISLLSEEQFKLIDTEQLSLVQVQSLFKIWTQEEIVKESENCHAGICNLSEMEINKELEARNLSSYQKLNLLSTKQFEKIKSKLSKDILGAI